MNSDNDTLYILVRAVQKLGAWRAWGADTVVRRINPSNPSKIGMINVLGSLVVVAAALVAVVGRATLVAVVGGATLVAVVGRATYVVLPEK